MSVTIRLISNTRARLEGDYDVKKVSDLLSYHPPGYQFSRAYKRHVWDGYVRLLSNGMFPAGLAWMVEDHLVQKQKIKVKWRWDVKRPPLKITHTNDIKLGGVNLYPWQKKATRVALAAGRGILKIATGGGKTEVMSALIRCLQDGRPPKTLIIVPNRNLLMQTKERLEERLGFEVGAIGYGKWFEDYVTVAIPDTLSADKFKEERKNLFEAVEMLILDEAHHAASQKWSDIVNKCPAYYRFGLSGTPLDRGDGSDLKLEAATGPLLVEINSSTLVSQGKLAKPTVRMLDVREPELPPNLDWQNVYSLGIVQNYGFHQKVAKLAVEYAEKKKQVLILVTRIDHGHNIEQELELLDSVDFRFLHGSTPADELKDELKAFKKGKFPVLIASPIFGEGTDIPGIDVLIIADGGKSVIRTIQKAGRAMRPKKGKPNECTLVDFKHHTHPKLLAHAERREEIYTKEGYEVNPKAGGKKR